jgi:hypothetical protein
MNWRFESFRSKSEENIATGIIEDRYSIKCSFLKNEKNNSLLRLA